VFFPQLARINDMCYLQTTDAMVKKAKIGKISCSERGVNQSSLQSYLGRNIRISALLRVANSTLSDWLHTPK
jgi:hypothetical protein